MSASNRPLSHIKSDLFTHNSAQMNETTIILMSWEELIPKCSELLTSYNPKIDSPDTHFARIYGSHPDKNESVFLQQVFYNVNRYRGLLDNLVKALFAANPTTTSLSDAVPLMIFSYLSLFRFDELGTKNFRKIVETQEPLKMHVLLSFVFDGDKLREHVRTK